METLWLQLQLNAKHLIKISLNIISVETRKLIWHNTWPFAVQSIPVFLFLVTPIKSGKEHDFQFLLKAVSVFITMASPGNTSSFVTIMCGGKKPRYDWCKVWVQSASFKS